MVLIVFALLSSMCAMEVVWALWFQANARAGRASDRSDSLTAVGLTCKWFGAMDVTKPYGFIVFGAMDVTKPYEFIVFGAMDATKPCDFTWFL